MPAVQIQHLVVEYTSNGYPIRPLDGLTATIDDGQLALLLGPSGSGKTTLLSCLGGILRPTAGGIVIDGVDLASMNARELLTHRRTGVGFVFQAFNLIPSLSALDNVAMPLRLNGTSARSARQRAHQLLEQVGLGDRAKHRPSQLSGGQQQRVAIARGLASGAPLLLADEPTANLDYVQAEEVIVILRSLVSAGHTVIVSTHDDRLLPIADASIDLAPELVGESVDELIELEAGDVLFRQGTASRCVYLVEHGQIEVLREFADGMQSIIATRGAGEYLGELGPMLNKPRSATARAAARSTVRSMSLQDFRRLEKHQPA